MKKIYPGLSTFICLSFLFTLNSCTSDTPFESEDTSGKSDAKNEIHNFNSKKTDAVPAYIEDPHVSAGYVDKELFEVHYAPDSFPESISTYSAQTEPVKVVDPDWKNLITHFIEVDGGTE
ncbi:MAG: hypothetical protein C0412_12680 [Flavobacterium sp.]|nr:hypothetical protein [Flavobacterium sp.]